MSTQWIGRHGNPDSSRQCQVEEALWHGGQCSVSRKALRSRPHGACTKGQLGSVGSPLGRYSLIAESLRLWVLNRCSHVTDRGGVLADQRG